MRRPCGTLVGVNRIHRWYCNREAWKRHVGEDLVPAAIDGLELGEDVLEIGPGFGPATQALVARGGRVTALEIDRRLARALRERLGGRAEIVEGSGTAMPFAAACFSAAACFTMLHHVPSADDQDRLFAEVRRVLRPGAPFAGTDSTGRGLGFAFLHIADTKVLIDPAELTPRLHAAGFEDVEISAGRDVVRFRARRPHT